MLVLTVSRKTPSLKLGVTQRSTFPQSKAAEDVIQRFSKKDEPVNPAELAKRLEAYRRELRARKKGVREEAARKPESSTTSQPYVPKHAAQDFEKTFDRSLADRRRSSMPSAPLLAAKLAALQDIVQVEEQQFASPAERVSSGAPNRKMNLYHFDLSAQCLPVAGPQVPFMIKDFNRDTSQAQFHPIVDDADGRPLSRRLSKAARPLSQFMESSGDALPELRNKRGPKDRHDWSQASQCGDSRRLSILRTTSLRKSRRVTTPTAILVENSSSDAESPITPDNGAGSPLHTQLETALPSARGSLDMPTHDEDDTVFPNVLEIFADEATCASPTVSHESKEEQAAAAAAAKPTKRRSKIFFSLALPRKSAAAAAPPKKGSPHWMETIEQMGVKTGILEFQDGTYAPIVRY